MRLGGSFLASMVLVFAVGGCGDDDGNEAIRRGIGSECALGDGSPRGDCEGADQICLTEFSGGYCGARDCTADADCPVGSACVTDDGTTNYCFLICLDKPECNP